MKFTLNQYLIVFLGLLIIALFILIKYGPKDKTPTPPPAQETVANGKPISTEQKINPQHFYAPILLYHHIAQTKIQNSYYVSPDIFQKQMNWLKENGYHVISMDKLYEAITNEGTLPDKPIVISFDDSLLDQYKNAYPILKKYGYPAIFFVKMNNIGNQTLSWAMIKEMSDNNMIIGSHSVNHDSMTNMDQKTLSYELSESKRQIEKHTGKQVKYFSYPGGAYSGETIAAVKYAGYLAAVCTKHKVYQEIINNSSIYMLPRIHIDNEMPTFIDWVQGKNLK